MRSRRLRTQATVPECGAAFLLIAGSSRFALNSLATCSQNRRAPKGCKTL